MSNWTVAKVYVYMVALITFIVVLFNFIQLVRSIPEYLFDVSYSYKMSYMDARNELYMRKYGKYPDTKETPEFSEEEIKKLIDERYQEDINRQKSYTLKNIVTNGVSFLVLLPIHIFYFRLARKSEA